LFRSPESIPLKARLKRSFFARHSQNNDKGKQREEPLTNAETPSHDDPASPAEFDTNQTRALLKVLIRARGKVARKAVMNTHDPPAEVVEICAARGFKASLSFHHVNPFVLTKGGNDRDMSHTSAKIRQNHCL
jgi:hypothetical protein